MSSPSEDGLETADNTAAPNSTALVTPFRDAILPGGQLQDQLWTQVMSARRHTRGNNALDLARKAVGLRTITVSAVRADENSSWAYKSSYVILANRKRLLRLMLDTGATHNLICMSMLIRYGIRDSMDRKPDLKEVQGLSTSTVPVMGQIMLTLDVDGRRFRAVFYVIADDYVHGRFDALICRKFIQRTGLLIRGDICWGVPQSLWILLWLLTGERHSLSLTRLLAPNNGGAAWRPARVVLAATVLAAAAIMVWCRKPVANAGA